VGAGRSHNQPVYTDCIEPLLDLMHPFNKADTSSGCSTAGYSNPVSLWLTFFPPLNSLIFQIEGALNSLDASFCRVAPSTTSQPEESPAQYVLILPTLVCTFS
jgi:hypothetical protein